MEETILLYAPEWEGEATAENHEGWIPLQSVNNGLVRNVDMGDISTAQRGYGKSTFTEVEAVCEHSKASSKIMTSAASGQIIPLVEIEFSRSGADPATGMETYLRYKLQDVMVTSFDFSGSASEVPTNTFKMAYRFIEVEYSMSGYRNNKLQVENSFVWNLETGRAG